MQQLIGPCQGQTADEDRGTLAELLRDVRVGTGEVGCQAEHLQCGGDGGDGPRLWAAAAGRVPAACAKQRPEAFAAGVEEGAQVLDRECGQVPLVCGMSLLSQELRQPCLNPDAERVEVARRRVGVSEDRGHAVSSALGHAPAPGRRLAQRGRSSRSWAGSSMHVINP